MASTNIMVCKIPRYFPTPMSVNNDMLTPKGPMPFFCQKPPKTAISAAFT